MYPNPPPTVVVWKREGEEEVLNLPPFFLLSVKWNIKSNKSLKNHNGFPSKFYSKAGRTTHRYLVSDSLFFSPDFKISFNHSPEIPKASG